MDFDISTLKIDEDDWFYRFAVITSVPPYVFEYADKPIWKRIIERLAGIAPRYTYYHVGQIVICTCYEDGSGMREVGWGAKPNKHNCGYETFTSMVEAIQYAERIANERT